MKQLSGWNLGISLAAMCVVAASAGAQTTNHVAWSKIDTGSWTFNPIYSQAGGGGTSVNNFLALADPFTVSGDNIVAVWYQRGSGG